MFSNFGSINGLTPTEQPAARGLQVHLAMANLAANLLALQNLELGPASSEAGQRIAAMRKKIPESLLTQFDRWMARGRKAVAMARNGVCCECHIKLAVGILGALAFGDEIQRCGNCGRFLFLPEDEPVHLAASSARAKPTVSAEAKPARRRKKASTHAS